MMVMIDNVDHHQGNTNDTVNDNGDILMMVVIIIVMIMIDNDCNDPMMR